MTFLPNSVATGRVIFEIGGAPIREELARDSECITILRVASIIDFFRFEALRQAGDKLPTTTEFITRKTLPRLGSLEIRPEVPPVPVSPERPEIARAIDAS